MTGKTPFECYRNVNRVKGPNVELWHSKAGNHRKPALPLGLKGQEKKRIIGHTWAVAVGEDLTTGAVELGRRQGHCQNHR